MRTRLRIRLGVVLFLGALLSLVSLPSVATSSSEATLSSVALSDAPEPADPHQDAGALVRAVLNNEIEAQINDHSLWMFRKDKIENGHHKVFYVCQTKEGQIERLVTIDGEPLAPKQAQAEDARIHKLLTNIDEMREQQKKEQKDGEQARALLKAFPNAFHFQQISTKGNLVEIKFTPKPNFHPSSRPEHAFPHIEGLLLLEPQQKRLAGISGKLVSEVKFGGGLLGHLDKGGTFAVEQQEIGQGYWEVTALHIHVNGKALLFKTISIQDEETYSDFKPVPESTTLAKAAEILKNHTETQQASMK